ncbi:acyl-CoA N-acyltransferase [Xylariaceae sp. FL1272]|nr:acyl-CoA N-acyltransferase [Xylariaceae sp. FL1272]
MDPGVCFQLVMNKESHYGTKGLNESSSARLKPYADIETNPSPLVLNFTHAIPSGRKRSDTESIITALSSSRLLLMYICLPPANNHFRGPGAIDPIPIGVISLTRPAEKMVQHANSMMSLLIREKYQRQGYGTEAITWALDWAFDYARLHRVELSVYDWNKDAIRLYKRLGFMEEGVKREALWFKGKWHDMHEMGILEQDWKGRKEGRAAEDQKGFRY